MRWFESERPLTPAEQARYDEIDARIAAIYERHQDTPRQKVDMAIARTGGFLAACLSLPWWWYAIWMIGGALAGAVAKAIWRHL